MSWVRWTILGFGVVGGMVAASVLADPHGWERSVQWAEARERQWLAAGRECPVLFGEVLPGGSYEGYMAAGKLGGSCAGVDEGRLRELASSLDVAVRPSPEDREMLRALAPAVALLRTAAHRAGGAGSWPVPEGGPRGDAWLLHLSVLIDALRLEARDLQHAGDVAGAIEVLLDGVAAGVDLNHSMLTVDQMIGTTALEQVLTGFDGDWWADGGEDVLRRLAAALATVDAALPCECQGIGDGCATMVLALARTEQWNALDLGLNSVLPAWQHGFSVRRLGMVNASRAMAVGMQFEREAPKGAESWAVREARMQQASTQVKERCNLSHWSFDHVIAAEQQRREVVTRLRLLRLAVARRLGDGMLQPADPFGDGLLEVVPTDAGVLLRSSRPGLQRAVFEHR